MVEATSNICQEAENGSQWPSCDYFISPALKLLYCPIPKVACGTIKLWFAQVVEGSCQRYADIELRMPLTNQKIRDVNHGSLGKFAYWHSWQDHGATPLEDNSWYRFAFVRNPWARLVSAFLNKFIPVTRYVHSIYDEFHKRLGNRAHQRAGRFKSDCNIAMTSWRVHDWENQFTFRHFVEFLRECDLESSDVDLHWRPQYRFLGSTRFHYIGRFERLQKDFETIHEVLNVPHDLTWANATEYRPPSANGCHFAEWPLYKLRKLSKQPSYRSFYTRQMISLVGDLFSRDIEAFGYDF